MAETHLICTNCAETAPRDCGDGDDCPRCEEGTLRIHAPLSGPEKYLLVDPDEEVPVRRDVVHSALDVANAELTSLRRADTDGRWNEEVEETINSLREALD